MDRNGSTERGRRWAATARAAAIVLLGVCAVSAACADSLWDRREQNSAFLFSDNLAARVGDNLTVFIEDQSSFKKDGEREMEKTTTSSGSVKIGTDLVDFSIAPGNLSQQSSRKFAGSNAHTASRQFLDSITCTVVDTLPNGNLVVAGRATRSIDGEDIVTALTGIVRPEDISSANAISSTRVAHLGVYYETTDDSDSYMQQGWLNKIIGIFWPF